MFALHWRKFVTIFCTLFPHLYFYSEVLKFLNISNCCRSSFSFYYHFWALWKREKCERTRLHSSQGRQAMPQKNRNRTARGPHNMGRINIETDKEGKRKQRIKKKKAKNQKFSVSNTFQICLEMDFQYQTLQHCPALHLPSTKDSSFL